MITGHRLIKWLSGLAPAFMLALFVQGFVAPDAHAVPAFAVQTGQPCEACHVGGFGPQLTPFGRNFKINGYTSRSGGFTLPISAMLVASYNHTAKNQDGGAAPGYGPNDNFGMDQLSFFLAGGYDHFGAFVQTTYDGVAKAWSWDNLDLRAVTKASIKGTPVVFGLSFNNSPTVQDPFNTTPAWGFPYTFSALAPTPSASPMIANLAQTTLGITAYAWLDNQYYVEIGGYQSPSSSFLIHAGADPTDPGSIRGTAPYARLAWQKSYPDHNFEIGAFFFDASIYPGLDRSTGTTDRYTDVGFDATFQKFTSNNNVFSLQARFTHEHQSLRATQLLDGATNVRQDLEDLRIDASYYWHNKIGLTAQLFDTWGSTDPVLWGGVPNPNPQSSGFTLQLDATPWGGAKHSPLGPRFNMRVGLQYTDYFTFNGAGQNFDGLGGNASDNNTLRLFAWIAY
jgi:hypothetical protein